MAVVENVESLILLADGYLIELQGQRIEEQKKGCSGDGYLATMEQIVMLKEQLLYQIEIDDMGERTDSLYSCLLLAVENYSGASISVDPNSSTSGNTIVIVDADNRPSWFDFYWDEMTDEDGDGARYVYTNPILDGWNPSLQTGTTLLYLGVDYDMYAGGIIKLRSGNGIYDGQSIRADNFQPYDAPIEPVVEVGVALIQNNSSQSVDYNDNYTVTVELVAGDDYEKDPIIDDQTMIVIYPPSTTLTMNVYNSDGTVFETYTQANSSGGDFTYTKANMLLTKRYEFIITNT